MRISVALCTYNGAKYLAHQLESFVRQEHKPDEVIVRDDRSTDATPVVLERFAETAPFAVRWAMNDRHLGSTANFDRTMQECTGALIALCDQDDVWRPEKLQRMEAAFHGDPSLVLAASNAELIDAEGQGTGRDLWSAVGFSEGVREQFRQDAAQVLLRQTCLPGATMVFRRELLPMELLSIRYKRFGFGTFGLLLARDRCDKIPPRPPLRKGGRGGFLAGGESQPMSKSYVDCFSVVGTGLSGGASTDWSRIRKSAILTAWMRSTPRSCSRIDAKTLAC